MKRCKLCGNAFRKGVLAFHKEGSRLKGGIVCQSCAAGGVLLVAAEPVQVSDGGKRERQELRATLAPFVKQLKMLATMTKGREDDFFAGKVEGLEVAIALLEGGRT